MEIGLCGVSNKRSPYRRAILESSSYMQRKPFHHKSERTIPLQTFKTGNNSSLSFNNSCQVD